MSIAPVSPSPGPTVSGSGCADDETRFYIQFRRLEWKASSPCSTSRADHGRADDSMVISVIARPGIPGSLHLSHIAKPVCMTCSTPAAEHRRAGNGFHPPTRSGCLGYGETETQHTTALTTTD